ncbi:DUF3320 domain-containing protein [Sphingobacterium oryzagri]|uniref:DUF3320 domain-containing protein n=1 Tax=Sphingobacterium oryzagri TaxID=3025669 RepID=A0ABY7WPX6_9SPHI|nr:DUF3320 domain-containing protein [Sphingobacterium sp. KACC 22765]WDF70375.1 DUF3320 domain-containing protein [Sphingobacterium sp. KACC 22765]
MSSTALLQLSSNHHTYFNYTFCLNSYSFLDQIVLNEVTQDIVSVELQIQSSIGLFEPYRFFIDELRAGKTVVLERFDFHYNLPFLRALTEKDIDTIAVTVVDASGNTLATEQWQLQILPMDYFGGLQAFPQLLASYVLSNHPAIYDVKTKAIDILQMSGLKTAFEGYQGNSKERVLQMVSAIYKAIQSLELIYSAMPPSFEKQGQRIRLLDKVIANKFGNCIDISLLFASCLEAIDLHPLLIIAQGYAFVGVWLADKRMDSMINVDQTAISKRIAKGNKEIALIETTSLCKGNAISFTQAMEIAEAQLFQENNFLLSMDIKNIRAHGISPLPTLSQEQLEMRGFINEETDAAYSLDDDFDIGAQYDDLELTDFTNLTKTKLWERKLLDLSLRNNLLNVRFTKSMLQLVDIEIAKLEDALAEGKSYTIQPNNNLPRTRKYTVYEPPIHHSLPLFKLSDEEFDYNRLLTYYQEDVLDSILTNLYRSAKLAEEENGKSTLYLGVGLLKWYDPKNKDTPRLAPILLVPVELSRRSVNSKFNLRSREEETMINITLLEYLKQEFRLKLNSLETLPMDESGVDVAKVLALMRNAILNLEGWDILEQFVLGIFSFNKLILWQDISKFSEEIQKSSIVKSLISGQLSEQLESVEGSDRELEELSAAALTLPIATDNSQLNAVKNANANKTFILHGPPGTGKSQTITNIIADALANDKKVLFVAAKKAALEVVQNRLEKIGIGPFCLELHSNKSKKSDVLSQFEQTLSLPKYQLTVDFQQEASRLDERKRVLSSYVEQLHHRIPIGWSLYDSISFLEQYGIVYRADLQLNFAVEDIAVNEWNIWNDWVTNLAAIAKKIGMPAEHPLRSVVIFNHQFDHKERLTTAITQYVQSNAESKDICLTYDIDINAIDIYERVFDILKSKSVNPDLLDFYYQEDQQKSLHDWLHLHSKKSELETSILNAYNRSIFKLDVSTLSLQWNRAMNTWFLPKWLQQRKIKNKVQAYAKHRLSDPVVISKLFTDLEEIEHINQQLTRSVFSRMERLSHQYATVDAIDVQRINNDLKTVKDIDLLLQKVPSIQPQRWIEKNIIAQNISKNINQIIATLQLLQQATLALQEYTPIIPKKEELQGILSHMDTLELWINYNFYLRKGQELTLDWFLAFMQVGKVDHNDLQFEFEKIMHLNHFIQRMNDSSVLHSFDADVYNSNIEQYKKLHAEFTTLSRQQLIMKLRAKIPNFSQEAAQSSEVGILQKAIRSKGRGLSLRKLFDQIPTLIPRLKPCMLMSPISVAQYFDVSEDHFDLVIFDEASQLPTSEAISALARAKQAIIVGDPKQMPPTSFFASQKSDEDHYDLEDLESILEDCLALSIPSNYLLRHYRSKHESLISFSNKNFYDNKLLTFPSPDDRSRKVTFRYIDGFYDKGKTRTNLNEAQAIVNYIAAHLNSDHKKSIGVVTFSQTQQSLIEDLLQNLYQQQPALEGLANQEEEPIFIKNLENVQGDERDIILFSIGYGPDEEGKVSMNFGPLNRDGGWRRLNVAVTRARYEMKIFSSLKADQIDLNRTKSEGVKGLKEFLNFAEKGIFLGNSSQPSERRLSLVHQLAIALEKEDLKVSTHIGTSNYKIDIGILHPENEHQYVLGILVDGENYFNIHTTNDRELLAPGVLQVLGWNIFRIWTIDWIKNKEKIIREVKEAVNRVLQDDKNISAESDYVEIAPVRDAVSNIVVIKDNLLQDNMKAYEEVRLNPVPFANSESIYFAENRSKIQRQMLEIIAKESPISKNLLFRKIKALWNTARAGAKLQQHLNDLINQLTNIKQTEAHDIFFWAENTKPEQVDFYRDNSVIKRDIYDISTEELQFVVTQLLQTNLSLDKMELLRLVARAFGFQKVGTQVEAVIDSVLNNMEKKGLIANVLGRIGLAEVK